MGLRFTISGGYKVKAPGDYSWPCAGQPERTLYLEPDDVLTKDPRDGTYTVQTGLGCFGICLTDAQVELIGKDVYLKLG